MSRRTSRQSQRFATRRKGQVIIAVIVLASLFASWTMLASSGALDSASRQKGKEDGTVSPANFNANSPSKEYVYVGGRLVATEEPTPSGPVHHASTIGAREPSSPTATFYLSNSTPAGNADITLLFGQPGWIPISGDWDGNGTTTIGAYDPLTATFYLRSSNDPANYTVTQFTFGAPNQGWMAIAGDWDGDGTTTIGVYAPATGTFYLRKSNSSGGPNYTFIFGGPNWIPISGDWDGDGTTTVGAYDPSSATRFYLRSSNTNTFTFIEFPFGGQGWIPITGDWDGNGTTTIGAYDPIAAKFYLRNSNSFGFADFEFNFGLPNWKPITGDWDGQ